MTRRYVEVDAGQVPARCRQAGENAVTFAATDLGIPRPAIRWFADSPTTAAEAFAGLMNAMTPPPPAEAFDDERAIVGKSHGDGCVWIRADVDPRRTAEIALHETLHEWQAAQIGPAHGAHEYEGRELQARTYSADLAEVARAIANSTKGESNA